MTKPLLWAFITTFLSELCSSMTSQINISVLLQIEKGTSARLFTMHGDAHITFLESNLATSIKIFNVANAFD